MEAIKIWWGVYLRGSLPDGGGVCWGGFLTGGGGGGGGGGGDQIFETYCLETYSSEPTKFT